MDPLTMLFVSAALTGAGAVANNQAQNQVNRARRQASGAEAARQRELRDEAMRVADRSRTRFDGAEGQRETRAAEIANFYGETAEATAPTTPIMPTSGSAATVAEQGRRGAEDAAFIDQQRRSAADVRSFGDFLANTNFGVQRDVGESAQIGGFSRGSAAVLPLELDAANQRGANMRLLGDVLSGFGRVGTMAAVGGGGMAPAPAPTPAVRAVTPAMFGMYGAGTV